VTPSDRQKYSWLGDVLARDGVHLVTANRRLARTLRRAHADQQLARDVEAWRSPAINALPDWLALLLDKVEHIEQRPLLLTGQQSRVVWEQCLRAELDDPFVNFSNLARQCRDTWQRLQDWCVPLEDCEAAARSQDQKTFVRAAARYQLQLHDHGWTDTALLPGKLAEFIRDAALAVPGCLMLVGFDRRTPRLESELAALVTAGTEALPDIVPRTAKTVLQVYDNSDAELRAAGDWARQELLAIPTQKIAIVVPGLEQTASRSARLVREGIVPGWQHSGRAVSAAVNLSYGSRLASFPAIHAALLLLRWCFGALRSTEISVLLRSPSLGQLPLDGRSRLELHLRDMPDRQWSRELLVGALAPRDQTGDSEDWLERLKRVTTLVDETNSKLSPSAWAALFDRILKTFNWPGTPTLGSAEFQLNNRWRSLLNEFAELERVVAELPGVEAVARLASLAGETVFQPEAGGAVVDVLGPLEAAGMEFDRLWMSGATASDWPPPSRPVPMLARSLQIEYGMPDSTPEDTADYARRVIARLKGSAAECVFSYPAFTGDAEQLPSSLLGVNNCTASAPDPGWYAARFAGAFDIRVLDDRVPAMRPDELLAGGATSIQLQASDPFAAFAAGRLGIRWMAPFTPGVPASLRGSLVHGALFHFYRDRPAHKQLSSWTDKQTHVRISAALNAAFSAQERHADPLLKELLLLERRRTALLLENVLEVDRRRSDFRIERLEEAFETSIASVRLRIRIDRIDKTSDDSFVVLDYKTGTQQRFLARGEPKGWQLVVYSIALGAGVGALGLFNVGSRQTQIDAVGPALGDQDDVSNWNHTLHRWQEEVRALGRAISQGDVRLNIKQGPRDARAHGLLSRYAELQRAG
jgi:probable DNA repair protein